MNLMLIKAQCAVETGKEKAHAWFRRVFKEQAGGAELIATLIIIGIVLILAFAFKDKLIGLVKNLWNNLIAGGNEGTTQSEVVSTWN